MTLCELFNPVNPSVQPLFEKHLYGYRHWGFITPDGTILDVTDPATYTKYRKRGAIAKSETHYDLYLILTGQDGAGFDFAAFNRVLNRKGAGWVRWFIDENGKFFLQSSPVDGTDREAMLNLVRRVRQITYSYRTTIKRVQWDIVGTPQLRQVFGTDSQSLAEFRDNLRNMIALLTDKEKTGK